MIPRGFTETVTITRQSVDAYGDHAAGASHDQPGCVIWPTAAPEIVAGGMDITTLGLTVFMPADADILSTDTVTARGVVYQVSGEPGVCRSALTGTTSGIEVLLKAATG